MCNYFVCFARSEGATLCQYLYEDYILKYVFIYGKDRERKADRVDSERTMDIKNFQTCGNVPSNALLDV